MIRSISQFSLVLFAYLASSVFVSAKEQPNIIFILTDDQGYGDIEAHGHPYLKTPHTNRLREESVRFDNFYVSPSCSPTRAALLTGMHEFRNGVTHTLQPREHLYAGAVTLPDLLKTAGYRTGFIGKWHLGDGPEHSPQHRGFDWNSTNTKGPREHFDPEMIRNGKRWKGEGFREDLFFDEAMTFIDESGEQPFFCYLATYSPHTPLDAPESFIAPFREAGLNDIHATYLAMIENVDYNVGRLMAFLKERGLDDNTIVIFMNDNGVTEGLDVYNAGMRGSKCTVWEGGSRAMSFWRWPNHWKPQTHDNLTAHLDVLPTLCKLAGVQVPDDLAGQLEGFDLLPLLEADCKIEWHSDRFLYHHVARWPSGQAASHKNAMSGIRQGELLLIQSAPCGDPACEEFQSQCTTLRAVNEGLRTTTYAYGTAQYNWGTTPAGHWALFNVKEDPGCLNDISKNHPEKVSLLAAAYDGWWDGIFPDMIARGGDLGDPNASRNAASRARQWKAKSGEDKQSGDSASVNKVVKPLTAELASMFKRMDTNQDQKVTEAEYVSLFVVTFANRDKNSDGFLDSTEFPASAFKHADSDENGQIVLEEYKSFYAVQYNRRDANQDGLLEVGEM